MNKLNSVNSEVFLLLFFGRISCSYFDPSSQKCDKMLEAVVVKWCCCSHTNCFGEVFSTLKSIRT